MKNLSDYQLYVLEKAEIDCQDVEALLGDYVDGDLTPTIAERLAGHIEECSYCQEIESGYRLTIELADELRNDSPAPEGVKSRLMENLNKTLGLNI